MRLKGRLLAGVSVIALAAGLAACSCDREVPENTSNTTVIEQPANNNAAVDNEANADNTVVTTNNE